jgi:hypothetical protein
VNFFDSKYSSNCSSPIAINLKEINMQMMQTLNY